MRLYEADFTTAMRRLVPSRLSLGSSAFTMRPFHGVVEV